MPSVVAAQSPSSEKKLKMKKVEASSVEDDYVEKNSKKVKKSSKKTKLISEPDPDDSFNTHLKKNKEKKRKALEIDDGDDEERSETSMEIREPMNDLEKKKKRMKLKGEQDEEEENPNAVSNFRILKPLRDALKVKGIESLFPIQAMTFDTVLDGSDLVGRVRTGQRIGHRVEFILPVRGFPCQPQQIQLKRGVDIVVGTPGLIKDHIERGNIDLRALKFRVLDEADEMLRIGFVEDVELILVIIIPSKVQTLLFSATLPAWVKQIAAKFLKPDKKTADLVGNEKMKASTSVRHIVLPCSSSARSQLISDIIRCYSRLICFCQLHPIILHDLWNFIVLYGHPLSYYPLTNFSWDNFYIGGRTIIFTETKDSASTLAGLLPGARALRGDIQQATRECEPPRDVEAYIHRSGRTGRAGSQTFQGSKENQV